jgi:hypothetical protein
VNPKSLVLVAGAVAILAAGVYLFMEVHAAPAQAGPSEHTVAARAPAPPPPHDLPPPAAIKQPNVHVSVPVPSTPQQAPPPPSMPSRDVIERVQPPDETRVDMKIDNMMELANKAYDKQDFEEATAIAGKVLSKDPTNVRMLRIMVSANCIGGDSGIAQTYYEKLPKFDRDQMKQRCDRYGVTFKEPPQ